MRFIHRSVSTRTSALSIVLLLGTAGVDSACGGSSAGPAVGNGSQNGNETGSSGGAGSSSGFEGDDGGGGGGSSGGAGGSSSGSNSSSGSSSGSKSGSSSGSSSSGNSSGSDDVGSLAPPNLPTINGTCPTFSAGSGTAITVSAGGSTLGAKVWGGNMATTSPGGPLIIYWHGTSSSPGAEIPVAFDTAAVAAAGGLIVGFDASTRPTGAPTSGNTGDDVWYSSDGAFADQVVACAIKNYNIDPRHIHTAGYSAGGLQTVWMWFARSGYLASVISYSGGDDTLNHVAMQDTSNYAPAIVAHGAMGSDTFILDFAQESAAWESEIKTGGGFSIDCNDGGNHLDFFSTRAPNLKPVAWQFFKDHPFGVKPEPYTALPTGFPTYCKID